MEAAIIQWVTCIRMTYIFTQAAADCDIIRLTFPWVEIEPFTEIKGGTFITSIYAPGRLI